MVHDKVIDKIEKAKARLSWLSGYEIIQHLNKAQALLEAKEPALDIDTELWERFVELNKDDARIVDAVRDYIAKLEAKVQSKKIVR